MGGTAAAERNVISGNFTGIELGFVFFSSTTGNVIRGNYIGTDSTGTVDLGNSNQGVVMSEGSGNSIGGSAGGAGNLISGNNRGVQLSSSGANNTIQGNLIGTDAAGSANLGNTTEGVQIDSTSSTVWAEPASVTKTGSRSTAQPASRSPAPPRSPTASTATRSSPTAASGSIWAVPA